jgi:hypothetical protein
VLGGPEAACGTMTLAISGAYFGIEGTSGC